MRPLLLAALLSSTALMASAGAQTQPTVTPSVIPQGEAQGRAAMGECERLADFLREARQGDAGVTVEQAHAWRQEGNGQACHDNLERLKQAAAAGSSGNTIKPVTAPPTQPQASADPATPQAGGATAAQILVQQTPPSVTVRQQQPEVIVRMPPPVITVQQPQPEVIVRMPQPDVNVSVARPDVQVTLPQPQVQVVPPQQAQIQPRIEMNGQQPNVRVERTGEPQVVYRQAEGQPQVHFETVGAQPQGAAGVQAGAGPAGAGGQPLAAASLQAAQAQLNSAPLPGSSGKEPALTGALPSVTQKIPVDKLEDMDLYSAAGEKMGEVEEVVSGPGDKLYLVVAYGGFLGLGEKQVAIPVEQVALRGDRLVADGLSETEIRAMPAFDDNDQAYKETEGSQTAPIRVRQ